MFSCDSDDIYQHFPQGDVSFLSRFFFLETHIFLLTYIHNEKVQPAPVVGEILLEAIGDPLEEHFQHKDVGEYLVGSLQNHFYDFSLLDVDIFKCLRQTRMRRM